MTSAVFTMLWCASGLATESLPNENPCTPIFLACEEKGYVYDTVADPGQKIWADCADPIINRHQKVRGLQVDTNRVKLCQNYQLRHEIKKGNEAL